MKNILNHLGIIVIAAVIGFAMAGCDMGNGDDDNNVTLLDGGSDISGWWYINQDYTGHVFSFYIDGIKTGLWGHVGNVPVVFEQKTALDNSFEVLIARFEQTNSLFVTFTFSLTSPATIQLFEVATAPGEVIKDNFDTPHGNLNGQTLYKW